MKKKLLFFVDKPLFFTLKPSHNPAMYAEVVMAIFYDTPMTGFIGSPLDQGWVSAYRHASRRRNYLILSITHVKVLVPWSAHLQNVL